MPFFVLPPVDLPPAYLAPPALRYEDGSLYWQQVLSGTTASQFAPSPAAPPPPDVLAGVKVELVDEGVDTAGKWYQTFRVTILRGGTISDAAVAIYNDIGRSDEVFRAAQHKTPTLTDATHVFVGQQIDLTVDPSTVFVYKETRKDPNGVRRDIYYNRVVETYYSDPKLGIVRTVEFPVEKRTQEFRFTDSVEGKDQVVAAKLGTRLVDYQYVSGDKYGDIVAKVFGVRTAKAVAEFLRQTGWDPNQWPPAVGAKVRIFVDRQDSYADAKPPELSYRPSDPAAAALWQKTTVERSAVGIFPLRMATEGFVYQVQVGANSLTARQAAKLLFNDESHYLDVVAAAGLTVPADPSKSPDYNPMLTGRIFQIQVPFAQEGFAYVNRQPGPQGALVTKLANGTVIDEYDRPAGQAGLLRVVYYPNDYKYMVERPSSWSILLLDFLHFQVLNLASPEIPREQQELNARDFEAKMIWTWSRNLPRSPSDTPDSLKLTVTSSDTLLDVLAHPRTNVPWQERLVYELWFAYPAALIAIVLGFGTLLLFLLAWRAQRVQKRRRVRPH